MNELQKSFIDNGSSFLMHYNHNHDKLGRFARSNGTSGSGSSASSDKYDAFDTAIEINSNGTLSKENLKAFQKDPYVDHVYDLKDDHGKYQIYGESSKYKYTDPSSGKERPTDIEFNVPEDKHGGIDKHALEDFSRNHGSFADKFEIKTAAKAAMTYGKGWTEYDWATNGPGDFNGWKNWKLTRSAKKDFVKNLEPVSINYSLSYHGEPQISSITFSDKSKRYIPRHYKMSEDSTPAIIVICENGYPEKVRLSSI